MTHAPQLRQDTRCRLGEPRPELGIDLNPSRPGGLLRLRAGANMPLGPCTSSAAVAPCGPYIGGPQVQTASPIGHLLSMACC